MKKVWNKNTIPYAIASIVLFAVLFCFTFPGRKDEAKRQAVQLVTFGDSVFGEVRDETAIPAQISELLGMSCYNAAFGGTRMARADLEHRLDYAKDSLCMAGLMKSLWADDFGVQQTIRIRESSTEYFEETVEGLANLDFSKVEMVLIQHGLNDYYSGTVISNEEDPYDEYTFTGALRTSLSILKEKYPELRIVIVTPTYSWYIQDGITCEERDIGNGLMEDYVAAELAVAEEFGVEVIDLYHDFLPHEKWEDWELYTRDGLHPNEAGRALIAERIAEELRKE